ncbi:hypothetical protein [Alteromonas lipolytica]|uniref:Lipoprotein n=1 Tax=Alteromonas lipolytica TaxID=1856405 RepID=A0A1E8FCT3_9ALTE|nr:hypothetical protein [Alteromonas lipolytica]OFI33734.1 hypothetical protein BFC17_19350 [Alteromonas lipolytica]GGF68885.1 hypothetical protein GCM10011338_21350 [Alteromonas lipolytica]
MELKQLFQASAIAAALALAGCGGDINISEGDIDNSSSVTNNYGDSGSTGGGTETPAEELPGEASASLSSALTAAFGTDVSVRVLSGRLTDADAGDNGNVVLTNDTVWALDGPVFVGGDKENSVTLEIEEGTIIFGSRGADYLVVSRDSQIEVNGTASAPVIMTSYNDVVGDEVGAGQWGGVVLLGNAPSTKCPQDGSDCALQVEGAEEGAVFGGTDAADSSGTINYLVVKYAGYEVAPDNELNGITFGGVGSGTEIDYVQVHANADDGVEFFGGSVDVKHLVLTGNQDDSVDWDNGYNGRLQYVYVAHAADNSDANRGIEGDGDGGDGTAFSLPTISNMTVVGNTFDTEDADSEGLLLRDQTGAHIMNLLVTGPEAMGECLEMDSDETVQGNLSDGDLTITYSAIACSEPFKMADGDVDLEAWFTGQEGNQLIAFEDRANLGLNIDGSLTSESAMLTAGTDASQVDTFFDATTFIGAVGADDWRQGWAFGFGGGNIELAQTRSGCPTGTTTITDIDGSTTTCEISGTITSDLTLTAGNYYALSGAVFVGGDNEDSAVLTVEPGVTVYGNSGNDYLVVSRGSQIMASGTAADPITFTSRDHVLGGLDAGSAGQWGGMIILGNAYSTKCPQDGSECALQVEGAQEGAVFGGNDNEDNSGTLRYVRVMHGGYEIAPDNELNGITFGGVGSGTTVEYVQVHKNADDGVEFFGGAVNAKYLAFTGVQDDSVDWDNGFQGKLQFVLVKHADDNSDANRAIEGDGDGGSGTEFSNPMVANMTVIGNTFDTADADSEGILLRDQTNAQLFNIIVTGPAEMGECFEADLSDGDTTLEANMDGTNTPQLTFSNSVLACSENIRDTGTFDQTAWFTAQAGNSLLDNTATVLDGIYTVDATAPADVAAMDSFFLSVDFIGAVKDADNDWTAGWTVGLE